MDTRHLYFVYTPTAGKIARCCLKAFPYPAKSQAEHALALFTAQESSSLSC